jgi:hypothetical protein
MKRIAVRELRGIVAVIATIGRLMVLLAAMAALALPASGAIVTTIGGPAVSDNLTYSSGIFASSGDHWANSGTSMDSSVQQVDATTWLYTYQWNTAAPGAHNLSHILIQTTSGALLTEFSNFSTQPASGDPQNYSSSLNGNSDMGMPSGYDLFGFKFSSSGTTDFTFSFDSHHAPTYGDFFAKDGNGVYAYNAGFTDSSTPGDSLNPNSHIIVPDGLVVSVPEPNYALAASLLLLPCVGMGLLRKRSV